MSFSVKKTCRGIGIALSVIIILIVSAKIWLGATIKSAVNNIGPKVLGVPVSVESVSVDIIGGKVRLKTLTIGNPEGFESTPFLFQMGSLAVDISMKDLFKGQTHIYDIIIDGPKVWYHKKLTSSNVSTLLDILEEKYPQNDKKKKDKKASVVIDHLLVKEGTIGLKFGVGGEIPLLEIELKDIGKDGALMPVQVIKLLITSIFKGVLSAVTGIGGVAVDAVGGVGSAAISGVTSVAKGIGSLFGGSSETNASSSVEGETKVPATAEEAVETK